MRLIDDGHSRFALTSPRYRSQMKQLADGLGRLFRHQVVTRIRLFLIFIFESRFDALQLRHDQAVVVAPVTAFGSVFSLITPGNVT